MIWLTEQTAGPELKPSVCLGFPSSPACYNVPERLPKNTEAGALLPHTTMSQWKSAFEPANCPQLTVQTVTPWASTFPSVKGMTPSP